LRSLRQLKVDYLGFALVGAAVTCTEHLAREMAAAADPAATAPSVTPAPEPTPRTV